MAVLVQGSVLGSAAADPPATSGTLVAQVQPAPSPSLEALLAPIVADRVFRRSTAGVQVVDVRTGEEVFARGADTGFIPASTMKVITSATALRTLGPAYRFTTELLSDGALDEAGVLRGNLFVRGGGDPTMVVEKLWKMALDLRMQGVVRVAGDVIYDESFFGPDHRLIGWNKAEDVERGPSYFPRIGALSLNFNTAALVVGPGPEVGGPARVSLETPAEPAVVVVNEVTTGVRGGRSRVQIRREVEAGQTRFTVTGTVPASGDTQHIYRTVDDPTAQFMAAFRGLLTGQGIQVSGTQRLGETPDQADVLLTVRSPPLAAILMDMNKLSNNFIAETVLRAVGAETSGEPGTTESGLRAVREYVATLGVDEDSVHLVNGSGLSRDARVPPALLTAVLVDMAHDPRVGAEFQASLAIAGVDGTLWRRLRDEPARLRGKTGTIDGTHCLAAYAEAANGERYAFAFLVNDVSGGIWQVRDLHDRFARALFAVGGPQP